jgi:hypothetical protein
MLRKHLLLILAVLILILGGCATRNTAWEEENILTLIKEIPIVGDPLDISFDDENIYIALDQGGISIIDRTDYSQSWLTELSADDNSVVTLYNIRSISVVGEHNRLFFNETYGADNITIVDTQDPDTLKVIDSITGATQDIQDMLVQGIPNPTDDNIIELLYCAGRNVHYGEYNGDLWLGSTFSIYPPVPASGVALSEQYVFVAAEQRGLMIYDRETQELVSEIAVPGEALKVTLAGDYAYIAGRQSGLSAVNISQIEEPVLMGNVETTGYARTVDVWGNLAVVSSGGGGIYLFDISSPGNPRLIQNLSSVGYSNNARFCAGKLIVATRDQGVLIYAID